MFSRLTIGFVLVALVIALRAYAQQAPQQPQVHTTNGIRYVSGGFGQGEREQLQQTAKDYPLKVVFATQQGEYIGSVTVQIQDARNQLILETVAEGPWLFIDLEPGQYTVKATAHAQSKQQSVQIAAAKQAQLQFAWTTSSSPATTGDRAVAPRP